MFNDSISDNIPYEKVGDNEPVSIADEVPFEIPESWEWVRLGEISTYAHTKRKINAQQADKTMWGLDLEDIEKGGHIFCYKTVGERNANGDKTLFSKGDILYSKLRPYLLKILVAPKDGICTSEIIPFTMYGKINAEYIIMFLKSPFVDNYINSITYGVKMPRVGTDTMVSLLVPLPPLSEQHRIVEKIDELLPFINEYDEKEKQLTTLNATFHDSLKKSILQQAVQGKLVPQDPTDEPASVLLERIRNEKQRLIKEGKIKKDKQESIIYRRDNSHYERCDGVERCIDEEIPFEIPESWVWCRLKDLVNFIGGYAYKSSDFLTASPYQVLRLGNVKKNNLQLDKKPVFISEELAKETLQFLCLSNDILITMTGTRGKRDYFFSAIIKDEKNLFINQRVGCLRPYTMVISSWLKNVLQSESVLSQVFAYETGTANQGNLGSESILEALIALPPFVEQKRIVTKIEKILKYIDKV